MKDEFVLRNVLDGSTITPVSQETNFPAKNVLTPLHYQRWRVAGSSAQADFALVNGPHQVDALLIRFPSEREPQDVPHRFGINDSMTWSFYNGTPGAGTLIQTMTRTLNVDRLGYSSWRLSSVITGVQAIRLQIDAAQLTASGDNLEIENVFVGKRDAAKTYFAPGAIDRRKDLSQSEIHSYSGAHFAEARARYDDRQREWQAWDDQQIKFWMDFESTHGSTRHFVWFARSTRIIETARLCRFAKDSTPTLVEGEAGVGTIRATIIESR